MAVVIATVWVVADGMAGECLCATSWPCCICIEKFTSAEAKSEAVVVVVVALSVFSSFA